MQSQYHLSKRVYNIANKLGCEKEKIPYTVWLHPDATLVTADIGRVTRKCKIFSVPPLFLFLYIFYIYFLLHLIL